MLYGFTGGTPNPNLSPIPHSYSKRAPTSVSTLFSFPQRAMKLYVISVIVSVATEDAVSRLKK